MCIEWLKISNDAGKSHFLSNSGFRAVFNRLTTHYEYSRSSRENLPLPIQRILFEKLKLFSQFFIPVLKCTLNLEDFEKR